VQAGALIADAASLAVLASMFAFNRENEREADHYGLHVMAKSGYAPTEASKTWVNLIDEVGAEKVRERSGFIFATHPSPGERIENLSNMAKTYINAENDGKIFEARYKERLKPIWRMLLADETRRRSYDESFRLFDRLITHDPNDGLLHFYKGEMHRQRAKNDDPDLALDAYGAAVKTKTEPSEINRSIGLIHLRKGDAAKAHENFRIYLARNPNADDRAIIESYLPKD
jgi:predicted Zn-dependent protease